VFGSHSYTNSNKFRVKGFSDEIDTDKGCPNSNDCSNSFSKSRSGVDFSRVVNVNDGKIVTNCDNDGIDSMTSVSSTDFSKDANDIASKHAVKKDANLKKNDTNILSCLYFNARSVANKLDELELIVKESNLDVIGITETWLTNDHSDTEVIIERYTVFKKDRNDPNKSRGGGVALYVKNNINGIKRNDLSDKTFLKVFGVKFYVRKKK